MDIKLTERVVCETGEFGGKSKGKSKKELVWTQGQNYVFEVGSVFYDTKKAYELTWGEALNGDAFAGITDYPKMIHSDVETPDLEKIGKFLQLAGGGGFISPDAPLEDHLRLIADFPNRDEATAYMTPPTGDEDV